MIPNKTLGKRQAETSPATTSLLSFDSFDSFGLLFPSRTTCGQILTGLSRIEAVTALAFGLVQGKEQATVPKWREAA